MKELQYPFDAQEILRKKKSLRRQLLEDGSSRFTKRIAVLGGSTTSDIVKCMELFLLDNGIEPVFYECEYAQYEQQAIFPDREFLEFQPDLIFLHTSSRNIRQFPAMTDSAEDVQRKLDGEAARFREIWEHLRRNFSCPIVQNNFEPPLYRILGSRDCADFRGRGNFITRLNEQIYAYAGKTSDFHVHDLAYAASDYGLREWLNPYYWNMYKYCMCLDAIPQYAFSAANLIKAIFGRNKKALALDLDNTLWGGVVGDDGIDGIEIGQETGVAQSYYEFQAYIREMKEAGVLLTVCSKNDLENALDGLSHPEGVLHPEDFVSIRANWENKDRNLTDIASELNILPESIVFVDDNPAERAIAEAQIPGLCAPVMDHVENYIITLDRSGFFEPISLNEDDLRRNAMYMQNAKRTAERAAFSDYGEYLKSLEMEAVIDDFLPVYLARITQLTNKSNQFNLTTRRYTAAEMEKTWKDPASVCLYGKLTDKFGDNGVVSVVIGRMDAEVCHIDLWLMSCRVLKRDMEQAMLDRLVEEAAAKGIRTIRGYYYPTKKNGMVRDLYGSFGFTKISGDEEGNTVWELPTEGYRKQNRYIRLRRNPDTEELQ